MNYSKKVIKWIGITYRRFESEISVKNVVMARPIGIVGLGVTSELPADLAANLKQLFLQCRLGAYQYCG